jgi:4-diphosphocytidyl-2-C-methyl-D-erythritol kinase
VDQLKIASYAKVNLTLDVGERRPEDGYHYIDTVMVPVNLADTITLKRADTISVTSSVAIPGPSASNLAWRAAHLLQRVTGYVGGVHIHIEKVIPIAGGMAGGSSNGAAVLTGLNHLWGTNLSEQALVALGIQLGSDVPFFIPGRPARVRGIGEQLTPIPLVRPLWLVVATPEVTKSTGNVFRLYDELTQVDRPNTSAMIAALTVGDLMGVAQSLGNVFEQVMVPLHPAIGALRQAMQAGGALGGLMSGAGPTVFGLVPDEATGRRTLATIQPITRHAHLVHTVGGVV